MIATMTTVDKLIEAFPIQTLTKIIGVPTYQSIKIVNDELSKNAATIPTTRGGGTLGHVGITVSPTIYATLSITPFTTPPLQPLQSSPDSPAPISPPRTEPLTRKRRNSPSTTYFKMPSSECC